ncbi:MAG: adenosine deaminase [Verrucomicrobiota bacterium]
MDELRAYIQALPKTETHLHMEGALPWDFMRELDDEKYAVPPASWQNGYKFRDFAHFEDQLLGHALSWYTTPERYHRAAKQVFAGLAALNVKYVETSFASGVMEFLGVDGKGILDAILSAAPEGMEVRVFLGIHHGGLNEKMLPVLEEALTWQGLTGIDLHGVEEIPVGEPEIAFWKQARAAGKFTKAHAGEFCGADFVRWCVEVLGALRIEHGVRAVEDLAVIELLKERDIALDICPISNVKLMPGITAENHPIRELVDAGVTCTVSTDDPLAFGNNLLDDYVLLGESRGFSPSELAQLARYGFTAALMPEEQKRNYLDELDAIIARA